MNNREKIAYLVQDLKNLMVAINDLEEKDMELESRSAHYEINIIAGWLHAAEIIDTADFLKLVRLFPFTEPFSRLQQINNIAIGFIESGPYHENENPLIIETMYKIEKISGHSEQR